MRKFNLRGTVVQRMKGIPKEDPAVKVKDEEQMSPQPDYDASFSHEQGKLAYAWRTDVGRLRRNNQDAVIIGNGLAGVADGMGGHNGGEIASAGLRDGLLRETENSTASCEKLEESIQKVNKELWEQQERDAALTGMGTTLTVLWPTAEKMIIAQVGDSRAYLLRNGALCQVTNDHSMVADMVRKGVLTEEQAACHPMRNYITRAVGTDDTIEPDFFLHDRIKGDCWLICSDGLHGMVKKEDIQGMICPDDLEGSVERLLQAALDNGGKDNVTIVLLRDDSGATPTTSENDRDATDTADKPEAGEVTDP